MQWFPFGWYEGSWRGSIDRCQPASFSGTHGAKKMAQDALENESSAYTTSGGQGHKVFANIPAISPSGHGCNAI